MSNESPASIRAHATGGQAGRTLEAQTQVVNEMRLSARQWLVALVIIVLAMLAIPRIWRVVERFETGPDYRIPYSLSKDYWLYERRIGTLNPDSVVMLGDSVIWGEYVLPDGTWSHFLNQCAGKPDKFVNAGVNGLFPLAMEGLVENYAGALNHRKIILHCNLLWLSNPKADMRIDKEERFNHSRLVPQFSPRIPCYRADASERLGVVVERNVEMISWVNHLQNAYFGQKSILSWTLADDGGDPVRYTNSYKNPLAQIKFEVPTAPKLDSQRGPDSSRHKPWTKTVGEPAQFEWVDLESSLQWGAFQRVLSHLRSRGNDVFVILGPYNEHMVAPESRAGYAKLRDGVDRWLNSNSIPHWVPETLPSDLYADASHPLTQGYEQLAKATFENDEFKKWLAGQ